MLIIYSLKFYQECDITNKNKYLSSSLLIDDIIIDELLFDLDLNLDLDQNHHCNELITNGHHNISWSYLFEILYYCPPTQTNDHPLHSDSHQRRLSDGDINNFDNVSALSLQSQQASLNSLINDHIMDPDNPRSTYWLCVIIISILSVLSLCGCYYCCIQCIRCYQYKYFLCHCSCIHKTIKYICCCVACDEYNWFYKNTNTEYQLQKQKQKQMAALYFKDINSGDYMHSIDYERGNISQVNSMDFDQMEHCKNYNGSTKHIILSSTDRQTSNGTNVPFSNAESASSFNHRYKDRTGIHNNNRDRLRISVHSTSSWNTLKGTQQSMDPSANNTPIPEENALLPDSMDSDHKENIITTYATTPNTSHHSNSKSKSKSKSKSNHNHIQIEYKENQTQNNVLPSTQQITFRSPASIELSFIPRFSSNANYSKLKRYSNTLCIRQCITNNTTTSHYKQSSS